MCGKLFEFHEVSGDNGIRNRWIRGKTQPLEGEHLRLVGSASSLDKFKMNTRSTGRKRRLLLLGQQDQVPAENAESGLEMEWDSQQLADFVGACGCDPLAELLVVDSEGGFNVRCALDMPFLLIGRADDCDFQLPHPEVSFRHAYMQIVEGQVLCVDLGSRTGIHWPTGPRRSGALHDGETITIGPYSIQYLQERQVAQAETVALLPDEAPEDDRFPEAWLELLNRTRSTESSTYPLWRCVTLVGRERPCRFRLVDQTVSRVHCSLVRTPTGVWVVDLASRGGTSVNGVQVRFARLNPGDELQVGRFRFVARYGQTSLSTPAPEARNDGPVFPVQQPSAISISQTGLAKIEASLTQRDADTDLTLTNANPSGFSESFVVSLINQFATMQQQMFSQTHQQMMMMMQMFGSIHQSQQELIRDDLERIHEITREMQELQAQLLQERAATTGQIVDPDADASDAQVTTAPEAGLHPGAKSAERRDLKAAANEEDSDVDRARASGAARVGRSTTNRNQQHHDEHSGSDEKPHEPTRAVDQTGHTDGSAEIESNDEESSVKSHAWLAERMGTLESERDSRWGKIMRVLTGAGS